MHNRSADHPRIYRVARNKLTWGDAVDRECRRTALPASDLTQWRSRFG